MGSFTPFIIIILAVVIISIVVVVYQSNKHIENLDKISLAINKIDGFKTNNIYISPSGKSAIAIDEQDEIICIVNNEFSFSHLLVSYRDILSVEIIEDGESITKTSRSSQLGGALLGTVLLGGVGTIIGGLSGSKKTTGKVNSLFLRIVINNTKNPDKYISFLHSEADKNDFLYKNAIENARKWQSIINVLIRKADAEDEINTKQSPLLEVPERSYIDQLETLANLLDRGALTEEEFLNEKKKLLNS